MIFPAMEVTHLGHACFKLKGKNLTLVIDPFDSQMVGLPFPKIQAEAVLCTHDHRDHHDLSRISGYRLVVEAPGEYEIGGAQILGVKAFHDHAQGQERGIVTLYQIRMEGLTLVHLGDLGTKLSAEQVESLNGVDILMIPVGGVYTLGAQEASAVVAQLEPKIVIPMHYQVPGLKFNLEPRESFLKEMGAEGVRPQPKLLLTKEKLPEKQQVVVLE